MYTDIKYSCRDDERRERPRRLRLRRFAICHPPSLLRRFQESNYPTSLGLDCQIQARSAGFGNPAGAVGIVQILEPPKNLRTDLLLRPV